jgi:hypothetical protein
MRAARRIVPLSFRPLPTLDMRKGMRDRCGVARRASRLLVSRKIPRCHTSNVHTPPSSTDHNTRPGEDSANPDRYRLKSLGGPGRARHFGLVFAQVIDSCNPLALVAPSALPRSE